MKRGIKLKKLLDSLGKGEQDLLHKRIKKIYSGDSQHYEIFKAAIDLKPPVFYARMTKLVKDKVIQATTLSKYINHLYHEATDFLVLIIAKKNTGKYESLLLKYGAQTSNKVLVSMSYSNVCNELGTIDNPQTFDADGLRLLIEASEDFQHYCVKEGLVELMPDLSQVQKERDNIYFSEILLLMCLDAQKSVGFGLLGDLSKAYNETILKQVKYLIDSEKVHDGVRFLYDVYSLFRKAPDTVKASEIQESIKDLKSLHTSGKYQSGTLTNYIHLLSSLITSVNIAQENVNFDGLVWNLGDWGVKTGYMLVDGILTENAFLSVVFTWANAKLETPIFDKETIDIESERTNILSLPSYLPEHKYDTGFKIIQLVVKLEEARQMRFSLDSVILLQDFLIELDKPAKASGYLELILNMLSMLALTLFYYKGHEPYSSASNGDVLDLNHVFNNRYAQLKNSLQKENQVITASFRSKALSIIKAIKALHHAVKNPDGRTLLEEIEQVDSTFFNMLIMTMKEELQSSF